MSFIIPTAINDHDVNPTSNTLYNSSENNPTGLGVKDNGSLPQTNSAGQWQRDKDSSTNLSGISYNLPSAIDLSSDTKLLVWHTQKNAPNRIQIDTVAEGGSTFLAYTGTGTPSSVYRRWKIGGNDTPMGASVSGPISFVIDLNDDGYDADSGTWDNTNVTGYGLWARPFGQAGNSSTWSYETPMYLFDTVKSSSDTPTFSGASSTLVDATTLIQGTDYTNKLGNWVRQIGSVMFIDVGFRIGDNSTATTFDDEGLSLISPVNNDSSDPRNRLSNQACRTYLNLRDNSADSATFSGTWVWQTRAPFNWEQSNSAIVTFNSPTFTGMGEFTVGSSITGPATFSNVDSVIIADTQANLDGSTFINQNGNYALELTVGEMDITDMRFETYTSAHAILIDTAGTYNFSGVYFDQTGTNDIETTHASGIVTINISDGGTVPTTTQTGAGTIVINSNVTIGITVTDSDGATIENARVRVTSTASLGTMTIGDVLLEGVTDSSGYIEETAFNYESAFGAGLGIQIKVRKGTSSPYYQPSLISGTIVDSGFTSQILLLSDGED
jgi:hypothetical protein